MSVCKNDTNNALGRILSDNADPEFTRRAFKTAVLMHIFLTVLLVYPLLQVYVEFMVPHWEKKQILSRIFGMSAPIAHLLNYKSTLPALVRLSPFLILYFWLWVSINSAFHLKKFHDREYENFPFRFGDFEWRMALSSFGATCVTIILFLMMGVSALLGVYYLIVGVLDLFAQYFIVFIVIGAGLIFVTYLSNKFLFRLMPLAAWRSRFLHSGFFDGWKVGEDRNRDIISAYRIVFSVNALKCIFLYWFMSQYFGSIFQGLAITDTMNIENLKDGSFSDESMRAFYGELINPVTLFVCVSLIVFNSFTSILYRLILSGISIYAVELWSKNNPSDYR